MYSSDFLKGRVAFVPGGVTVNAVAPGPIARVSPFYSTTLEAQLRAQNVQRIYCSGVSTQAVVQATVRDAHDRDYEVILLEDACAAHSAEEHANSIGSIGRFCKSLRQR